MRYAFVILSVLILSGCNSSTDRETGKHNDSENETQQTAVDFMKPKQLKLEELPPEVTIYGEFNEAWTWVDSLGDNLFVLYHQTKKEEAKDEHGENPVTGSVHTSHYLKKEGTYRSSRTSSGDEQACSFDLVCNFIPGSTTITDLDNDGFAEMKYQFIKACRSDVSPAAMHLKMREKEKSYVLIGTTWVPFSPDLQFNLTEDNLNIDATKKLNDELKEMERSMGKYAGEYQFSAAPPEFLQFARKEWLKYVKEKLGD